MNILFLFIAALTAVSCSHSAQNKFRFVDPADPLDKKRSYSHNVERIPFNPDEDVVIYQRLANYDYAIPALRVHKGQFLSIETVDFYDARVREVYAYNEAGEMSEKKQTLTLAHSIDLDKYAQSFSILEKPKQNFLKCFTMLQGYQPQKDPSFSACITDHYKQTIGCSYKLILDSSPPFQDTLFYSTKKIDLKFVYDYNFQKNRHEELDYYIAMPFYLVGGDTWNRTGLALHAYLESDLNNNGVKETWVYSPDEFQVWEGYNTPIMGVLYNNPPQIAEKEYRKYVLAPQCGVCSWRSEGKCKPEALLW